MIRHSSTSLAFMLMGLLLQAGAPLMAASADATPLVLAPHHVTISVADIDRESQWYQRVLGFREGSRSPHGALMVCRLFNSGHRLDLVWIKDSTRPPKAGRAMQQGWMNAVFATPSLEAAYQHLLAQGVEVHVDHDAKGGIEHLTFEDPEGNEIGLAPLEATTAPVIAH